MIRSNHPALLESASQRRRLIAIAVIVVLATLIAACGETDASESTLAPPPPDEHGATGLPYPEVPRVTADQAHAMSQAGSAVIVDVRTADAYAEAHVSGALSVPEGQLAALVDDLPKDKAIITYCT